MSDKKGFIQETVSDRPGGASIGPTSGLAHSFGHTTQREAATVNAAYLRGLRLSARDRDIVTYLGEIGYGTSAQIGRLFYSRVKNPQKKAQERLVQLWKTHVLDRSFAPELGHYGLPAHLVYQVGQAGLLLLSEREPDRAKPKPRGSHLQMHNTLLGEAVSNLAETGLEQSWTARYYGERGCYTVFQWDGRWVRMRPDGLLVLQNVEAGLDRPFFLEMDTASQEIDAYTAKVVQYEWYYRSGSWRTRNSRFPAIAVVVWSSGAGFEQCQARAEARLRAVIERVKEQRRELALAWFFTRLDRAGCGRWLMLDRAGAVREAHLFALPTARPAGAAGNR